MDSADFAINLIDRATGPAKQISKSFDGINKAAKGAGGNSGGMAGMEGSLAGAVGVGTLFAGVLMKIGDVALTAVMAVMRLGAQAALSLAVAVGQATLVRERMTAAFGALTKGDGAKAFERVKALALEFGTDLGETATQFQRLFAMQFSPAMAESLFKTMQDLKAVGTDTEKVGRALTAITQIKATGKLQGDELLQLAEAGVSVDEVYNALQKTLGKSRAEILKMQAAGKISADVAIAAIQSAIGKVTGAAKPGDAAKKFMDSTLNGMLERIKNFGGIFFDDIAKELGPSVTALKPILDDVFAALRGPEVKSAIMGIAAGFKAVLGFVVAAWPSVKAFLGGLIDGFKQGAQSEGFQRAFSALKNVMGEINWTEVASGAAKVGQILGFLLSVAVALTAVFASFGIIVAKVVVWFTTLPEQIASAAIALGTAGATAASNLINGLVNGITGGVPRVVAAIKGLASQGANALASAWQSHSPSKLFENLGFTAPWGVAEGMISGMGMIQSASSQMALAGVPSEGGTSSSGISGGVTINVNVSGAGSGGDPERLGNTIAQQVRRELASLLDGM
jgi:tape measure domain-containing protein